MSKKITAPRSAFGMRASLGSFVGSNTVGPFLGYPRRNLRLGMAPVQGLLAQERKIKCPSYGSVLTIKQ